MNRVLQLSLIVAGCIVGLGVIFYGFELVSVPHIREYNESVYVIVGVVLFVASLSMTLLKFIVGKKKE